MRLFISILIIILSGGTAMILDLKYKIKLLPSIWYFWGWFTSALAIVIVFC